MHARPRRERASLILVKFMAEGFTKCKDTKCKDHAQFFLNLVLVILEK
jgi:hypothetical protein